MQSMRQTYPKLASARRARFIVIGVEAGSSAGPASSLSPLCARSRRRCWTPDGDFRGVAPDLHEILAVRNAKMRVLSPKVILQESTVAANVLFRDLNIMTARHDDRRIEVSGGASDESARRSLKKERAAAMERHEQSQLRSEGEAIELLAEACALLAQACVPTKECKALAMARLTALRKPDGGVRGIATGDTFRRLVSKTFAREWVAKFDQATRPFQLALQARAGTDALAAHVRAALETRPGAVLVSLDGRRPGTVCPWAARCLPAAFSDDLYVITSPSRARAAFDETASNFRKPRVIAAAAGPAPPGIAELGDDVWRGDKPDARRGVVVLGSP
ncbi:unnamed protein product, partial [Symbiodinium sp. KB8]